jgi:hypothetical protein
LKQICNGLWGVASDSMKKGITWFCIQFQRGDAGAILTTVVLLFHEQVKLVQPVQ